jgi:CheY-like chemotaxis protein
MTEPPTSSACPVGTNPILIVEDSDEDFAAFIRIIKSRSASLAIYRAQDGDDALDFLFRTGVYAPPAVAPRPTLILLDLNLPGTDGREVIEQVKQNEQLKAIPIVVFTTSSNPKDIATCYRYGANSYLIKPIGTDTLEQTIHDFFHYWFAVNVL